MKQLKPEKEPLNDADETKQFTPEKEPLEAQNYLVLFAITCHILNHAHTQTFKKQWSDYLSDVPANTSFHEDCQLLTLCTGALEFCT